MHQCSAMDWKREEVLLLIECYRNHPCLWNSTLNIASVKTASNDTKTLKLDLENNSIRVCTHRKRQRVRQNLGCSHRLRACVQQIGMASYLLEYDIFIRI